jgi:elongation factor G
MTQFTTEKIRTVALVGDGAAGKTTLAEALLLRAGTIAAAGSVERGTSVSDFDPLEKSYQHSLRASLVHFESGGVRVHMIDTPGFPDFIGQSIGALDAVETAAIVINASTGVQMIANRMMEWAGQRGLCRIVIINKIDAENVDLPGVLAAVRTAFGKECLPINLPAAGGTKVVDCFFNPSGESDFSSVDEAHRALVDQVVEGRRGPDVGLSGAGRGRARAAACAVREGAARRPSRSGVLRLRAHGCRRAGAHRRPREARAQSRGRQSAAVLQGRRRVRH